MDNTNLLGFTSHIRHTLAFNARGETIDGVSGYDLIKRDCGEGCGCDFTEDQRKFIAETDKIARPIEEGRKRILQLLDLRRCKPGFYTYEKQYMMNFEYGEVANFPADPTEWVEDWVARLCPDELWWAQHRRERDLGCEEYWSFGTPEDYLHFTPGRFHPFWGLAFPHQLAMFTRVIGGVITHQVVVPYILPQGFRADAAYALETPKF